MVALLISFSHNSAESLYEEYPSTDAKQTCVETHTFLFIFKIRPQKVPQIYSGVWFFSPNISQVSQIVIP